MKTFSIIVKLFTRNRYLQHYHVTIVPIYCIYIFIHNAAPTQEWIDTTFSTVLPEPYLYMKLKIAYIGGQE